MKRHGPWRTLGIDPTEDRSAIRRAYADKLRALDPDQDIDGYAKLRNARDHALALARSMAVAEAEADAPEPFDDGLLSPEDDALSDHFDDPEDWVLLPSDPFDDTGPFEPEPIPPSTAASPTEPVAPEVLLALLFPNGAVSEEPLTEAEWRRAHAAFTAILVDAEQSPIDRQSAIEDWLAHHLASAWPRSAWLVEDAAATFGWLDESGKLSERPAVLFLNQRLKGMRFLAKVTEPQHPLHRAWVELSKPGPRPAFAFGRPGRDEVRLLLTGIRERYPEVESHLDADRVASWETTDEVSPTSAWAGFFRILPVIAVLSLLRLCSLGPDSSPPPPPIMVQTPWSAEQLDTLVVELFGERLDDVTLRTKATQLWINIDHARDDDGNRPGIVEDVEKELLIQLRGLTQLAARDAAGADLIAIKRVKLALLRTVREQRGPVACLDFQTQALVPSDVAVPEEVRREERALAARLVRAGLLLTSDSEFPESARIPGEVIERVMHTSGLSEDAVRNAARGASDDETLCAYRLALLEAVLRRPAEASLDLLRML